MEENKQCDDARLTSPAAFVEGGIQDACDDACSICLEPFSDSDPSTLTSCKHEFHLQCILEWCQRSSQCPMCWQPISLKDPTSQELLEAVEQERSISVNPSRNTTIFHHPTLGDFELQGLPAGANDTELEERIIQHLAAAAMGRARHIGRRENQRNRSSAQARPQFFVFSTHPNTGTANPVSSSPTQRDGEQAPTVTLPTPSPPTTAREEFPEQGTQLLSASASGTSALAFSQHENTLNNRWSPNHPNRRSQDTAGPSDFQSFSESLKSRFNAVSMRYKESISKSTRGWKERFFSRYNTATNLGSEVRRENNAGMETVSGMMQRLETSDNNGNSTASVSNSPNNSVPESNNQQVSETASVSNSPNNSVPESNNQQVSETASVSDSPNNSVPESNNQQVSETASNNPMNDANAQGSCGASPGTN